MKFNLHEKKLAEKEEAKRKQREKVRLRFKEQAQQHTSPSPVKIEAGPQSDKEKKLRKQIQKKLQASTRKNDEQKKQIQQLTSELRNALKTIHTLKHENWQLQKEVSARVANLNAAAEKKTELLRLEQERRMAAEARLEMLENEKAKKKKRGDKQLQLANQVKQLKESNQTLKHKLVNYNLLTRQEHGDFKAKIARLEADLQKYRSLEEDIARNPDYMIKQLKNHLTDDYVPDLLDLIGQFITTRNLHHFYKGNENVFYQFMRRVGLLRHHSRRKAAHYRSIPRPAGTVRLGYISQSEDQWMFTVLGNDNEPMSFPVIRNASGHDFADDIPARAIIRDGEATIRECFSWEPPVQEERVSVPNDKPSEKKDYVPFGSFTVLILGSRFLKEYRNRLQKHGCTVELHNPYEESYHLMPGKISRADIVLVCERHVPHGIWPYVDKNKPSVSVLKKDSQDLLATHTYLTLKRCGLI